MSLILDKSSSFVLPPSSSAAAASSASVVANSTPAVPELPPADKYTLKWNDHQANITESIIQWREAGKFFDVTLVCEDGSCFDVHRIVLCVSSGYLESMLKDNPCDHPMIILKDVDRDHLRSILNFIYTGEIQLEQSKLEEFLSIAQSLKIKGLTDTMQQAATTVTASSGNLKHNKPTSPQTPPPPLPAAAPGAAPTKNQEPALNHVSSNSLLVQALEQGKEKLERIPAPVQNLENRGPAMEEGSSDEDSTGFRYERDEEDEDEEMDDLNRIGFHGLAGLLAGGSLLSGAGNSNSSQESTGPFGHHLQGSNQARLDLLRVRATDPRPCPKCGKIYRSAHTLRTHLEDKHTLCPGYRCVLCGTVAKSRNSLHSHMSRQHRGISTKDLPVLPMPSPFDPGLAARLMTKAGNGTLAGGKFADIFGSGIGENGGDGGGGGGGNGGSGGGGGGRKKDSQPTTSSTAIIKPINNSSSTASTGSAILDTYLHFIAENSMAALASSLGYNPQQHQQQQQQPTTATLPHQLNHFNQQSNTIDKNTGNNNNCKRRNHDLDDDDDDDDY